MKIDQEKNEQAVAAFKANPEVEVTVHLWGPDDREVAYPGYSPIRVPARKVLNEVLDFPECCAPEPSHIVVAGVEVRGMGCVLRVAFGNGMTFRSAVRVFLHYEEPPGDDPMRWWGDRIHERNAADGKWTPLALALQALQDAGCDCDCEDGDLGTCLGCRCSAALRDVVLRSEAIGRVLTQTNSERCRALDDLRDIGAAVSRRDGETVLDAAKRLAKDHDETLACLRVAELGLSAETKRREDAWSDYIAACEQRDAARLDVEKAVGARFVAQRLADERALDLAAVRRLLGIPDPSGEGKTP
jgi:hypothetical protein